MIQNKALVIVWVTAAYFEGRVHNFQDFYGMSVLKKLFYRGEREERREKLKTRFKNSY